MSNNPFDDGKKAFEAGVPQKKNPFRTDNRNWKRWNSGWVWAQIEKGRSVEKIISEQAEKEKAS